MTKHQPKVITPESYALSGTENAEQIALFCWAQLNKEQYPELRWMFAIPNGMWTTKSVAGRMKAMGMKAGVSDIMLPIKRFEYAGFFIELKKIPTPGKRISKKTEQGLSRDDNQNKWIEHFRSQGYGAMVCFGWIQARDNIVEYLNYKGK